MATTTKYLLPCECGNKVEVDTTQAGLSVECTCGTKLKVPSMRGLAECERVEEQAVQLTSNWGIGKGLLLLGTVIFLSGTAYAVYCWRIAEFNDQIEFTVHIDHDAHRKDVEELTPGQLWLEWIQMPRSLRSIQLEEDPVGMRSRELLLERYVTQYRRLTWLGIAVAVVGVALAVLGVVLTYGSAQKRMT